MPPRLSIARAIMASSDLKPKAIRVKRRTLVFVLSTSPLDSRCSRLALIEMRYLAIRWAKWTKAGIRQRLARPGPAAQPGAPRSVGRSAGEVGEQPAGFGERGGVAAAAGELAQGLGEHGLADAAGYPRELTHSHLRQ